MARLSFKFGQITGEIFIEYGLEDALNIDRDSFRETDVHYQAMRAYIWDKLSSEIFPDFKRRQKEFTATKKDREHYDLENSLDEIVSQLSTPMHFEKTLAVDSIKNPTISNWIEVNEESILFVKDKWKQFITDCGLTSSDAQDRFIRVIKVLLSNEYLKSMPEDEVNILLHALAIAVQ